MKRVLIYTYTNLDRDPRVTRQINWLNKCYKIDVICSVKDPNIDVNYYKIFEDTIISKIVGIILIKLKMYNYYVRTNKLVLFQKMEIVKEYDLIIVHHIKLLPFATKLKYKYLILDAHEYYPEIYSDSKLWNYFMRDYYLWLCKNYLNRCNLIIAVNEFMAKRYNQEYGVNVDFITNAVDYEELYPSDVDPHCIKLLHHGLASTSRKLENMIDLMKYLDERFNLYLILIQHGFISRRYIKKIKRMASSNSRIHFLDSFKQSQIVKSTNKFDIGIFIMPPSNYNEKYSLANKYFQYIQARLMLVVTPLPVMETITIKYKLGIVGEDFCMKKLGNRLNQLTADEIYQFKQNSHNNSYELSSESNKIKLCGIIENIFKYNNGLNK